MSLAKSFGGVVAGGLFIAPMFALSSGSGAPDPALLAAVLQRFGTDVPCTSVSFSDLRNA